MCFAAFEDISSGLAEAFTECLDLEQQDNRGSIGIGTAYFDKLIAELTSPYEWKIRFSTGVKDAFWSIV